MLLPLIALVAAAQVPPRDASALAAEDQVRDLCAALKGEAGGEPAPGVAPARSRAQTLARTYQLRVPPNGFGLGKYREDEQELALDGGRALRALDGALTLDLAGIDDVAFRATPADEKQWAEAKKAGKLFLTVYFHPSGERCAGNPAARIFRMEGVPLWWQLEVDSAAVAAADEEGLPVDKPGSGRSFRVDKVLLDTDMPRPDAGKDRLGAAQGALDRCAQAARRRGSLVVSFGVQDGHVRNPQVIMDAARDEETARCVSKALVGAAISGADPSATRGTASLAIP
jgi:hypothetical protein